MAHSRGPPHPAGHREGLRGQARLHRPMFRIPRIRLPCRGCGEQRRVLVTGDLQGSKREQAVFFVPYSLSRRPAMAVAVPEEATAWLAESGEKRARITATGTDVPDVDANSKIIATRRLLGRSGAGADPDAFVQYGRSCDATNSGAEHVQRSFIY